MNYIAVLVTLLLYFICWFLIATSKKNYGLIVSLSKKACSPTETFKGKTKI